MPDAGLEPLTLAEQAEKQHLESIVTGAVWSAGLALRELRDLRLYRDTHANFAEYCRERFGHSRQKSDYLIVAAKIYENLSENHCQVLPTTEFQVRPLGGLEPDLQVQAWQEAVAIASDTSSRNAHPKVPSNQIVKQVVRQLTRIPGSNPFEVGEVVGIVAKDHPGVRGRNGSWAIVTAIASDTCDLQLWDTFLEGIESEYLKEMDYTEEDCQGIRQLHGRLEQLQQSKALEPTAKRVLRLLGKIDRPYLTPLEEEMLKILEKAYR